jgi:putative inorganic carbon (HCO3(-)) transporter
MSVSRMKNEGIGVIRLLGLLLLTGLALFAGPVFEFLPDVNWHGGPVANALLWHDRQRIEQVVMLLMVAVGAATIWREALFNTVVNLPRPVRWALGLGFALGGVSAGLSEFPRFAGLEWATLLLLLGLALLLAGQARLGGGHFDVWAMRLVVVVSGVIVLRVMMGYLAAMLQGVRLDSITLFTSVFSNRRVFGQVACMVIPLLAYPLLGSGGTRGQRCVFALLALWWMLAIASGSRGTWVALAVAAVVLVALAWHASAGWLRIQLMALGVGAVLFAILFVGVPAWLGQDAKVENRLSNILDLDQRGELWATAWAQIQAHPWLGIGPMHLAAIPSKVAAHPHNAILQLAAEWGVPAALALLFPAVFGMQRLLTRLREQRAAANALPVCLAASLLAAGALSMVDGVIVMPYTQIWLALLAGWVIGVYFREDAVLRPVVPGPRRLRLGVPLISLFAFTLLVHGIFPEVLYRVEAIRVFLDAGNSSIPPRYWLVGRIP